MTEPEVRSDPAKEPPACARPGCRQRLGILFDQKSGRMLCAQHDPRRREIRDARAARTMARERARDKAPGVTAEPDELPVASIGSLDDALRLAEWIPVAIATGRLGRGEAMAVTAALREFRMMFADAEMAGRIAELEKRIKAAQARGIEV